MNREEQLIQEIQVLKERLYACHALGIPEVDAALQPHLDLMNLDVYKQRATLDLELRKTLSDLRAEQTARKNADAFLERLAAFAKAEWAKHHNPDSEPFPWEEI